MRKHINSASIAAVLLAFSAGIACAQGSTTQDPGRITPGNLTFQDLGPAGPAPGPTPPRRPTAEWPGANGTRGATGPILGPGTGSTGFGSGNSAGFGGNATGAGR
jgi:hypothetical protein